MPHAECYFPADLGSFTHTMEDYVPIQNIVDGRNPAPVDRLFIYMYLYLSHVNHIIYSVSFDL